jgi:hypothetical protein
MRDGLTAAGLCLTLVGALILAVRDLGWFRSYFRSLTWQDVADGLPHREARLGFPLIALGTVLQLVALLL